MLDVTLIPVLSDNYAYIIKSGDEAGIIDAGEADPVIQYLEENNLTPSVLFNTHHHPDHIGGNAEIKNKYGVRIIGPQKDEHRIKDMDQGVSEGDALSFGNETVEVMETPAHTSGHICLWFPDSKVVFSGDTLFSMGCGRLFEGTAQQMFDAMQRLKALPPETKVYCGHEYTQDNGNFCLSIEPNNSDLITRMQKVEMLRSENRPTIPSTIDQEIKTNVFMRAETAEELAKYREAKDSF